MNGIRGVGFTQGGAGRRAQQRGRKAAWQRGVVGEGKCDAAAGRVTTWKEEYVGRKSDRARPGGGKWEAENQEGETIKLLRTTGSLARARQKQ